MISEATRVFSELKGDYDRLVEWYRREENKGFEPSKAVTEAFEQASEKAQALKNPTTAETAKTLVEELETLNNKLDIVKLNS